MDMPNRIREHRKARGLTLETVADRLGTSASQISDLEYEKKQLTHRWMQLLARVLKVLPADLLPRSESSLSLSGEEQELLNLFRRAAPEHQAKIIKIVRILVTEK